MIKELWNSFPHLLEEKINALLDHAEPSTRKAFQLYKACQREDLWSGTFEDFSERLNQYFSLSKRDRTKSEIDKFLERPVPTDVYAYFQLDFHSALVDNKALNEIASWSHHLMRISLKTNSSVISTDILSRTLQYITNPPLFEKAKNIVFEDFCDAWKKIVFKIFGKQYDAEFSKIISELKWLRAQELEERNSSGSTKFVPTIYLTQTEITWTEEVKKAVENNSPIPKFPLSRGPDKQRLMDLDRTISLYRIVQTTQLPELLEQREKIRTTLLDRCNRILQECAR